MLMPTRSRSKPALSTSAPAAVFIKSTPGQRYRGIAFARFTRVAPRARARSSASSSSCRPAPVTLELGPDRDQQDPRGDVLAMLLDRERGRPVVVAEHFVARTEAHVPQLGLREVFLRHRGVAERRERVGRRRHTLPARALQVAQLAVSDEDCARAVDQVSQRRVRRQRARGPRLAAPSPGARHGARRSRSRDERGTSR